MSPELLNVLMEKYGTVMAKMNISLNLGCLSDAMDSEHYLYCDGFGWI